jgi:hypothetical protein
MPDHLCLTCHFADGKCSWVFVMPPIPASRFWRGFFRDEPEPTGGQIERRPAKSITECPVYEADYA